jgi:cytochrome o ubiquinol oxidase subunit 2
MTLASVSMLTGCKDAVLIYSKGMVGKDERELIFTALILMLLVVVPVIILTLVFAWKYRSSNTNAKYDPEFYHSNKIEAIVWGIPILIISILATITWKTTHELDPYRPVEVNGTQPITVQVVALDWKWLFIYPEQHIATVNYLAIPINTPIHFKITADAPMNSFMIPQLGGQIYAMAGMQTQLFLVADEPGDYAGRGVGFSGQGFNGMTFNTHAVSSDEFNQWVNSVKATYPQQLSQDEYNQLVKPSEYVQPKYYGSIDDELYNNIIMKFMMPSMDNMQGMGHM